MLLIVKSKLITNQEKHDSLLKTIGSFNEACKYILVNTYKNRIFSKISLKKRLYYQIREKYNLSSQMVVRTLVKVSKSHKVDKKACLEFKFHRAIVYYHCISTIKTTYLISILTLDGRIEVKIKYGEYRKLDYNRVRGQADLIYKNDTFYLMMVVDLPEDSLIDFEEEFLGVDLGIVNIATTSDGKIFSGKKCTETREHFSKLKAVYQKVGSYSAKKHLRKISGRERRFKKDTNHCISKEIVQTAKDTNRFIALEDLIGITERTTVRKAVRNSNSKWNCQTPKFNWKIKQDLQELYFNILISEIRQDKIAMLFQIKKEPKDQRNFRLPCTLSY